MATFGEKALYYIYDYNNSSHKLGENANAVNLELYKYITSNLREDPVMGGGSITNNTQLHNTSVEIIDHILPWINHMLAETAYNMVNQGEDAGLVSFNVNGLKILSLWGMYYMKDECVKSHCHFPYTLSFVYCVNAPEGSSPFCFDDGDTIHLKPGQMIVFHSHLYHHTLPNEVDHRCCLTGNALYKDDRLS